MLNVALTGNVAAGKSTVVRWFAEWGATIIDSDALVAEAQAPGSPVLTRIARRFGEQIIQPDGSLDRARLRRAILADEGARATLNSIMHPIVTSRREQLEAEARRRGDSVLVSDIPLLFEVLDPDDFDLVVLVDSPTSLRRDRLLERGLSLEEADQLMATQLPVSIKRERADIIVENRGSLNDLKKSAWAAWEKILSHSGA